MDIFALIAAFGGGIFGGVVGALPAFIFTGFVVLSGSVITLAGLGGEIAVDGIAFGPFFGPHIGFAGGVAAAAFAGKKKLMGGADIVSAPFGLNDVSPILVGGCFGVVGYLINFLYGGVLGLQTDTVAMTVATSGIIVRFVFGSTGIVGKYEGTSPREWFPTGTALMKTLVLGLGMGCVVGGIAATFIGAPGIGILPVVFFGISASTLIFTQCGFAVPGTHHITLPAGLAAVGAMAGGDPMAGLMAGIVVGIIASLLGDVVGRVFNSHCDSHIDPPAITIFTLTFIILAIF